MASPVQVGEEYDVKIETVGSKGDGVAKIKGYVVFVQNVKEGDEIKIRITKALDKVGFGEVIPKNEPKAAEEEEEEKEEEEDISESTDDSEENSDSDDEDSVPKP